MHRSPGLGRMALIESGEDAPRMLRALRELARGGRPTVSILLHRPGDRRLRLAREADEAHALDGSVEDGLRAVRADGAWIGPVPILRRAELAEACARAGVAHVGPPAPVLRQLCEPGAIAALARTLGVKAATPADRDTRRSIEVVVARDLAGRTRALGVGDASLRRGLRAVLVESPPAGLTPEEEELARELALRACAAAGWIGVCAVQQLFDPRARGWELLGIEALAQSAPALEALAGVDLAQLALRIAAGDAAGESAPRPPGHAFAARIVAGDPEGAQAIVPGPVELISVPAGIGIRADLCVREGEQPAGPDSLLMTLATRGSTRAEAADRLRQALGETDVLLRASSTSRAWLSALCSLPEFSAGTPSLGLLEDLAASGVKLVDRSPDAALLVAAIEAYHAEEDLERARFIAEARRGRPRVGPSSGREVELRHAGQRYRFQVRRLGLDEYRVSLGNGSAAGIRLERLGSFELQLTWQGRRHRILSVADGLRQLVQVDGVAHLVLRDPGGIVPSPMPAVVAAILVERGQRVAAGDPLARIESMKVEVQITAPFAGIVREVLAPVNGQVDAGAPLVKLEPLAGSEPELRDAPASFPLGAPAGSGTAATEPPFVAALSRLRPLLLGFDVTAAEARQIAADLRGPAPADGAGDPTALQAEDWALGAFSDIQSLFNRTRAPEGRPPLEELWRYLHEPERRAPGPGGANSSLPSWPTSTSARSRKLKQVT